MRCARGSTARILRNNINATNENLQTNSFSFGDEETVGFKSLLRNYSIDFTCISPEHNFLLESYSRSNKSVAIVFQ